ncbi:MULTISPECIES: M41 family metallopeptidase [unclassified Rhizobium]|uniref:hypothetical protein n=1 Tax=unclassified Rhizobium TaxID=2613769 RepID=UPI001ADAF0A8|nr:MULTISPECIES: hypothetical protein [unclassified Rhizobium]MBO9124964.1 hypothetical protein [Rhizobium sp. 16-488-2b]MBO9175549.1 hypothetical protein [Rhizobium sp. 16-488-2a]
MQDDNRIQGHHPSADVTAAQGGRPNRKCLGTADRLTSRAKACPLGDLTMDPSQERNEDLVEVQKGEPPDVAPNGEHGHVQGLATGIPIYTDADYFRMAVHEVGHALIALAVGYASSATIKISRISDSEAWYRGGLTEYDVVENNIPTEASMLNSIAVGYGGMAAEAIVFEARSVGSGGVLGSDLELVTGVARRMIGSYGFGRTPGYLGAIDVLGQLPLPERFEKEAMKILDGQYNRVLGILAGESSRIVSLASDVVTHRYLKLGLAQAPPQEMA